MFYIVSQFSHLFLSVKKFVQEHVIFSRLRQTKCYDYLRRLVPCGGLKTDKANILEATVAYLTYIKETLGTSMDAINKV